MVLSSPKIQMADIDCVKDKIGCQTARYRNGVPIFKNLNKLARSTFKPILHDI